MFVVYFYDYLFSFLFCCATVPQRLVLTGPDRTGPGLDHGLGPAAVQSCATEKTGPPKPYLEVSFGLEGGSEACFRCKVWKAMQRRVNRETIRPWPPEHRTGLLNCRFGV
jgi:hypothetical protein